MKRLYLLYCFTLLSIAIVRGQDSTFTLPQFRTGVGYEFHNPVAGPYAMFFYKGFNVGLTYGLSTSSPKSGSQIREINNAWHIQSSYALAYLYNTHSTYPVGLGIGVTIANEKENVKGLAGTGTILGTHYFIFIQGLWTDHSFFDLFGVNLALGYTSWNYSNSIFVKNQSNLEYNYPSFYVSLAVYYYII